MVRISVLNDCLRSIFNAEKRGKRHRHEPAAHVRSVLSNPAKGLVRHDARHQHERPRRVVQPHAAVADAGFRMCGTGLAMELEGPGHAYRGYNKAGCFVVDDWR